MDIHLREGIKFLGYKKEFGSLLVHGKVSDFMSKPPITLTGDLSLSNAKKIMRKYKISGLPIVDKENILRGIISIEDIINALEEGYINDPIRKHMTKNVEWLLEDMDIHSALQSINKYKYGRFPVINRDIKVVGVVTQGDLMRYTYKQLGSIYLHNKIRDEKLAHRKMLKSSETITSEHSFFFPIEYTNLDDAGKGATLFRKFLQERNFPSDIIRRASVSTYEAEVNVILHAYGKGYIKAYIKDNQIIVVVVDNGPGIEDIDLAVQPGYTTASDEVREHGFGAGMGLANIKKYTDKLVILSNANAGVKIEMVIVRKDKKET
jgi:CBS domain-containing protein/anti-sigma regulatory factor (Ser/Thr protein kinase)